MLMYVCKLAAVIGFGVGAGLVVRTGVRRWVGAAQAAARWERLEVRSRR